MIGGDSMKPTVINAVEYNSWITIMDTIVNKLPLLASEYGLRNSMIDVIPAYPRDLTKFRKPSIIVQKIYSNRSKLCMGNYIGQYYDDVDDELFDMEGRLYTVQYQINIDAESNRQMALLTEIILDISDKMVLKDYAHNMNNPKILGEMNTVKDGITYVSSNDNNDYISFIRIYYNIIQTRVGDIPTVDLSKPIKFSQRISI